MTINKGFSRRSFIASATSAALLTPHTLPAQDFLDNLEPPPFKRRSVTLQRLKDVRVLDSAKIPYRTISTQLILCIDSSQSAGDGYYSNFGIQIEGIAAAFESDILIETIKQRKGIGVTAVQFGFRAAQIVPWMFISDEGDSFKFAYILRNSLQHVGPDTGIVHGLSAAAGLFERSPFRSERAVVDVSGDGMDNVMPDMVKPLSVALTKEFSARVNGLIMPDMEITEKDLYDYYRNNIVTDADTAADAGIPEGRLWKVANMDVFAKVMQSKLIEEIVGGVMPQRPYIIQIPG